MSEHVEQTFLVGFEILDVDRAAAMRVLEDILDAVGDRLEAHYEADKEDGTFREVSYWMAEDDRTDGSDRDSAIFVSPGQQAVSSRILHNRRRTPICNVVEQERSNVWKERHG